MNFGKSCLVFNKVCSHFYFQFFFSQIYSVKVKTTVELNQARHRFNAEARNKNGEEYSKSSILNFRNVVGRYTNGVQFKLTNNPTFRGILKKIRRLFARLDFLLGSIPQQIEGFQSFNCLVERMTPAELLIVTIPVSFRAEKHSNNVFRCRL